MAQFILVLSALLLITAFGIHTFIVCKPHSDRPAYTIRPSLMLLPWVCGLLLPVLAWAKVSSIPWGWLIILNFVFVFFIAPSLTRSFIKIFSTKRCLSKDMFATLSVGLVLLVVGRILI